LGTQHGQAPAPVTASASDRAAERRLRTRSELVAQARRLTAEHGLAGFTIEQLCEAVGLSRRTFFNHFASKDDVVVGVALDEDDEALEGYASSRRDPRLPVFSTTLDDLAALVVQRVEQVGLTRERAAEFKAALDREPRLLQAMLTQGDEQQRRVAAAVASHEGVPADDPRIGVVVAVLGALVQRAMTRFFFDEGPPGLRFDHVLREQLVLARELFSATAPPLDQEAR
jgi:AcrR family transcriptional regulator